MTLQIQGVQPIVTKAGQAANQVKDDVVAFGKALEAAKAQGANLTAVNPPAVIGLPPKLVATQGNDANPLSGVVGAAVGFGAALIALPCAVLAGVIAGVVGAAAGAAGASAGLAETGAGAASGGAGADPTE
jgi:hypothetical protein